MNFLFDLKKLNKKGLVMNFQFFLKISWSIKEQYFYCLNSPCFLIIQ